MPHQIILICGHNQGVSLLTLESQSILLIEMVPWCAVTGLLQNLEQAG